MASLFEIKGFAFFCEFLIKSTLVLTIALCLSFVFRKQSAALRHFLLSAALIGLLFLPFISAFLPGWGTGFLPSVETGVSSYVITVSGEFHSGRMDLPAAVVEPGIPDEKSEQVDQALSGGTPFLGPLYRFGLIGLWCFVSCLMFVKVLFGLYGVSMLTRQGVSLEGQPWEVLLRRFYTAFGSPTRFFRFPPILRNVRLVRNKRILVPMTWGVLKPVVLLPDSSSQWPADQCSSVLYHELSHIKRWDFTVAFLARIACCVYWFNPLSRIAFRRLRMEQEKACDQMVLKAGIKPSTYASSLLHMKKSLDNGQGRLLPAAALGMAGLSEFNERLTTILTKPLKPKEIRMKAKILLAILVFLLVTLIGTANPYQTSSADKDKAVKKTKAPATPAVPAAPALPAVPDREAVPAVAAAPSEPEALETSAMPAVPAAPEAPSLPADVKDEEEKDTVLVITSGDSKDKKIKEIVLEGDETYYLETDDSGNVWNIRAKDGNKVKVKSSKDKDYQIQLVGGKIILTDGKGKDKGKHTLIIKTDGKKGKQHILIGKSEGKGDEEPELAMEVEENEEVELEDEDEAEVEISLEKGKTGHDKGLITIRNAGKDEELLVINEGAKDGKEGVQLVLSSDNPLPDHLQRKLRILVSELQKDLPKSYAVDSKIGKNTQKVSIDYPKGKTDETAAEKDRKRIADFMKEFKNIFSSLKDKKPLKKEILINSKTK